MGDGERILGVCVVWGDGDTFILEANLAVVNCRKAGVRGRWVEAAEEKEPTRRKKCNRIAFPFPFEKF